jgi:hypothetical protein
MEGLIPYGATTSGGTIVGHATDEKEIPSSTSALLLVRVRQPTKRCVTPSLPTRAKAQDLQLIHIRVHTRQIRHLEVPKS